mmetsp:Transcript_44599/g.115957  ORF Transcript_44599/g.115957 Transcript_44599/m.115957 type:complete len:181 (-) Transcript_44599:599-1141(-)
MNTSDNPNPVISKEVEVVQYDAEVDDEDTDEPINEVEIYEHLSGITDPEHEELSLAQLDIVGTDRIRVDAQKHRVAVQFTPTVPHCSVATLIGLSIRTKLIRALPSQYKIDVRVTPGSHVSEGAGMIGFLILFSLSFQASSPYSMHFPYVPTPIPTSFAATTLHVWCVFSLNIGSEQAAE